MFALPIYRSWPLLAVLLGWSCWANAAKADPNNRDAAAAPSVPAEARPRPMQSSLGQAIEPLTTSPYRLATDPSSLEHGNGTKQDDSLPLQPSDAQVSPPESGEEPATIIFERTGGTTFTPSEDVGVPAEEEQVPHPLDPPELLPQQGEPQLTLSPAEDSFIPADNRSTLVLQGDILEPDGAPISHDVIVTLTTTAGDFVGSDYDPDRPGFQVLARQGSYQARLRSGLEAQSVRVRAAVDGVEARGLEPETVNQPYPTLEAFTQVSFITNLRPSLFSGVVDLRIGPGGADFLDSFREFLPPDDPDDTDVDLGAALFGTFPIGEWQFTGAYNSERPLNERCDGNNGLFRDDQFCEQRYPVYGDSSRSDYLTPSIDSVYVRLQRDSDIPGRDPDYVMWGDYNTQEFARASQDFTATARQLHGFKGNYSFGPLQLTAMYANNLRPFQRDTIVPDGTSGYYFLSRRIILPGSEDVFIETEELNRPGTVVERQRLSRGADYEIDYDRGTLLFRRPILATDVNPTGVTLVRRIVVTYQVDSFEARGDLFASRLQYNFNGQTDEDGWTGVTVLTQDQGVQDFSLYGVDVLVPLGDKGQLVGEFAHSDSSSPQLDASGQAYRIEARGTPLPGVSGRAYFRTTDSDFRNNSTLSFRPGQTRWGGSVDARLGPDTQVRAQFDQETNFGPSSQVLTSADALLSPRLETIEGPEVSNRLNTLSVGVQQRIAPLTLGLDWVYRSREDWAAGTDTTSNQVVSRLNWPLLPNLTFLAQNELNISSERDPLYPTRTVVGLEYDVEPGVKLRLAQQFLSGGEEPGSITSLDTLFDHELSDNTTLTGRYSLLGGFNGMTGQGAIGLNHRVTLAPGLRANFALERIFSDGFEETGSGRRFAQPFAPGAGSFALGLQSGTAYSVGLEYTDNPAFQASARVEHRDSSAGDNTVISASAAGRITPALTSLFRYQHANFSNQTIDGLGDSIDLRLGMAYRNPRHDKFNGLLSYQFRKNPSTTPLSILQDASSESSDHTLSLEGIYAPNWQWEFYGKYAMRYSNTTIGGSFGDDFFFDNAIHLAQLRASYRFAFHWDILGEVRWIGQPAANFNEIGTAVELGYYLTPDLRIGVGYSFGRADDDSFGGSGARSAGGPYLGISMKVNQLFDGFGVQPTAPAQQEESYVDTAQSPANDPSDNNNSEDPSTEPGGPSR